MPAFAVELDAARVPSVSVPVDGGDWVPGPPAFEIDTSTLTPEEITEQVTRWGDADARSLAAAVKWYDDHAGAAPHERGGS